MQNNRELIQRYFESMLALIDAGIARSHQNMTGDIGEVIAAELLGGERQPINSRGDVLADGKVYEVKTVTSTTGNTSVIRDINPTNNRITTEWVVLVVLDRKSGMPVSVRLLDNPTINDCATFNSRIKAYALITQRVLRHPHAIELLTERTQNV